MARKPIDYYEELVVVTVNHMRLPRWYSREEGYSTGFLAVQRKLGKYRKSMKCNIRTYLRNSVRWAVKDELRKMRRWRSREILLEDIQYGPKESKEEARNQEEVAAKEEAHPYALGEEGTD